MHCFLCIQVFFGHCFPHSPLAKFRFGFVLCFGTLIDRQSQKPWQFGWSRLRKLPVFCLTFLIFLFEQAFPATRFLRIWLLYCCPSYYKVVSQWISKLRLKVVFLMLVLKSAKFSFNSRRLRLWTGGVSPPLVHINLFFFQKNFWSAKS